MKNMEATFWLVVYNQETRDFFNDTLMINRELDLDKIVEDYENKNKKYQVIHVGEGEFPPKTYRSLKYVND
ncbi:hypothetical protein [Halalkalibacter alkaliphilus]|uniref:Uncharacterized protein n=1 Tax=Halalkalibacter alkaliphilus TaxID=2917993 RepID=A0A9X2CSR0_9BACI|nr:hypothetical protein [Halalkalibacter alkaliphilus]MCL7747329.1 hypothetical protein [Halalkalibacter alkaliphilus]